MLLTPEQYSAASVYELLDAAAKGYVGIDRRWLRAITDRGEDGIPDLVRFGLEDRDADLEDISDDLVRICRHLKSPAAIPFLMHAARRKDFEFSDDLTQAFVALAGDAIEPLLALREKAEDKTDLDFALAALRIHDPRILEILIKQLEQDKLEGALTLGLYGDPAAKPTLEQAIAQVGAGDPWLRKQLEGAIAEIDSGETLEEAEPFDIYEDYPEEEDPALDLLPAGEVVLFLSSPVAAYRRYAAGALEMEEPTPETTKALLECARNDSDPGVRGACWRALQGALDDPEIRQEMLERLQDDTASAAERGGALIGLAAEADQPEIRRYILEFYERAEARCDALTAMWHSLDRTFSDYFPRHLDDQDPEIKRQAIWGTGWLEISSQLGRLEQLFEEDGEEFRDVALFAYALAAPAEVTPARMRSLFRKIEDLAGGFTEEESVLVRRALDDRLTMHGREPIFLQEGEPEDWQEPDDETAPETSQPAAGKVGRNEPCPCGSGKKHKKCCGA